MKDKKANGKYANMSPAKRFVHKNTGWLVLGVALLCLTIWWNYNQVEEGFYSKWSCPMLINYEKGGATFKGVMYDDLDDTQKENYNIFLNANCKDISFTNMTK